MNCRSLAMLALALLGLAALGPMVPPPVSAQTVSGTIAYVRQSNQTGDEVWLIEPDGSKNRRIWSTGQADTPENVYGIADLDWRSDAAELAFVSQHEQECSLYESDMYAIRPDGSGYRRITSTAFLKSVVGCGMLVSTNLWLHTRAGRSDGGTYGWTTTDRDFALRTPTGRTRAAAPAAFLPASPGVARAHRVGRRHGHPQRTACHPPVLLAYHCPQVARSLGRGRVSAGGR